MGFLSKLFHFVGSRKRREEPEYDWDEIVYDHSEVDFTDEEQRSRYITNCLEQIAEASRELNLLNGEYTLVTSYLTDMEEIEALPEENRQDLNHVANRLLVLEQERKQYFDKKNRMKDSDYFRMRKQEDEVQEGIGKLKEAEKYSKLVKQDMQRLDRERHAYEYRKKELYTMQANLRGMAVIFISALAACLLMLAVLQFGFKMDTYVGYFITVLAGAIAITVVCVKYIDADKEILTVERAVSKLIQLQNKVKIRYVNNTKLLEYYYIKYSTKSADELEKCWQSYQEEKEERKQFAEAEAKTEYFQHELVKLLSQFRVSDPMRWINQASALLDPREMVEIRHELILRRQSLRQQLDYNNDVAQTARKEIMAVAREHPQYGAEIMEMVDRYDQEGE
ncbi:MAG: hypothetical protein NC092_06415 [Butyrivibrio sp.]|nr:hypothetical protein [Muribaculum sp.]MCM1552309.1 hypothetical protein [Butyrivibrio sp.]